MRVNSMWILGNFSPANPLLLLAQKYWNSFWQREREIPFSPKHFYWQIFEDCKCERWSTGPLFERKQSPSRVVAQAQDFVSFIPKAFFLPKSLWKCAG